MKEIKVKREKYLSLLLKKQENGMIKVITGIRRVGKSFLLNEIYKKHLLKNGIKESQIISLELDDIQNIKYRNPIEMDTYIRSKIKDKKRMYYVFIDEIQKSSTINNPYVNDDNEKITFVDTILGLQKLKNVDLYITGSNSKMLSSDILSMFRGRGDEIYVSPLSFSEFYNSYNGNEKNAWKDYWTYGGMPHIVNLESHKEKSNYLQELLSKIYLRDILEHNNIKNDSSVLNDLLNYLSSATGSLTNPLKLSNTFKSEKKIQISHVTIEKYLDYFEDSFLIKKTKRYDIKGRKYINSPLKYYFTDIGLRNAKLNFSQQEENHIMENIIFNELINRGYSVDVGSLEVNKKENKKSIRKQLEIDFIANTGNKKFYIQVALNLDTQEKIIQEKESLKNVNDSFKKIIILKSDTIPWQDENGISYVGLENFLLQDDILEKV